MTAMTVDAKLPAGKRAFIAPLKPFANPLLQRKYACGGNGGADCDCEDCRGETTNLQRRATAGGDPAAAPPIVQEVLRSPGRPLDARTRESMEPRFGHDFSKVRVHLDDRAAQSASAVNALAYTVGRSVVFNTGQYRPQTTSGQQLIAHELVHVMQQNAATDQLGSALRIGPKDDASEQEADAVSSRIAPSSSGNVRQKSGSVLRRYGHDASCKQSDLEARVWPGNDLAKAMLENAISALVLNPRPKIVTMLLQYYFMTPTPDLGEISRVTGRLELAFDADDYMLKCLDDCKNSDGKAVVGETATSPLTGEAYGPVNLCMNVLRSLDVSETAAVILHEFGHRYAGLNDVDIYCYGGNCPHSLTPADALKNPDSYARFAQDMWLYKWRLTESKPR